jgi:hypothetical protein
VQLVGAGVCIRRPPSATDSLVSSDGSSNATLPVDDCFVVEAFARRISFVHFVGRILDVSTMKWEKMMKIRRGGILMYLGAFQGADMSRGALIDMNIQSYCLVFAHQTSANETHRSTSNCI